jgi:hypothetical protein
MHFGAFQLSAQAIDQPQADVRRALIENRPSCLIGFMESIH